MNPRFSEIQLNHLGEIREIYNWYVKHSTATFHTEPIEADQLLEFIHINHSRYKSYVIYDQDMIAGYCFLTYYKKREAYDRTAEVTIYLKQEYCGKGIGKKAMSFLEEKAREVNLNNLIGIISGDNHGSIALFEKCGYFKCAHFKNIGEKFGLVLDVVAFQKELS